MASGMNFKERKSETERHCDLKDRKTQTRKSL